MKDLHGAIESKKVTGSSGESLPPPAAALCSNKWIKKSGVRSERKFTWFLNYSNLDLATPVFRGSSALGTIPSFSYPSSFSPLQMNQVVLSTPAGTDFHTLRIVARLGMFLCRSLSRTIVSLPYLELHVFFIIVDAEFDGQQISINMSI